MLTLLTDFGAAGLVGMLWLMERRAAAARERQIDEAHQRIMASNQQLATLGAVIDRNTRAIESLEVSQRRMLVLLERQDTNPRPPGTMHAGTIHAGTMNPAEPDPRPPGAVADVAVGTAGGPRGVLARTPTGQADILPS